MITLNDAAMRFLLLLILTFTCFLSGAQTKRIEFEAPRMYPEGIVYDAGSNIFYVSSVTTGTIGKVDSSGKYSIVFADSSLKSTFGMKLSSDRKTLWVCAGDPSYSQFRDSATYKKMIRLIGIDLSNGNKAADIDISSLYPGKHFANDLALDDKGNIYITDSYSPVIYKVDGDGNASVFSQSEWFGSVGVGLNGIVWHPGNFLLVANNGSGCLLKVDIKDPSQILKTKIDQFFPGADGLLLDKENNLLLVQNKGVNKIFKLKSADNTWRQASVIASTQAKDRFSFPSTITSDGSEYWVMNAKLHELSDSNKVLSKNFSLQQAVLIPVK